MNLVYLAHRSLSRNRFRSAINTFAVAIAFFLFNVLSSIITSLDPSTVELSSTRMVVQNKIGITESLPISYYQRLKDYSGVKEVSPMNWFGGYYMEEDNLITTYAVDPISYLKIYPEIKLSAEEWKAWVETRNGVIVGEDMVARTGWKIGDSIPLKSNIFTNRNGGNVWDVVVVGVFRSAEKNIDSNKIFMQYEYFNYSHTFGEDWTGLFLVSFENPEEFSRLAAAIDADTANSFHETKSVTESAFQQEYFKRMGDISYVISNVIFAAFFAIMLVVCTSMYQHAVEKVKETAILKTFGFRNSQTVMIDLIEASMVILQGFLLGLLIAYLMIDGAAKNPALKTLLPNLGLSVSTMVTGCVYALCLTLISGFIPSFISYRVKTLQAISRDQ